MESLRTITPDEITTSLIAPCGMDCGLCRGFRRRKAPCVGCRGEDSGKPSYCVYCKIKTCERIASGSLTSCAECDDIPCARLRALDKRYRAKYGMSMLENLARIRDVGVEAFVAEERVRWRCPGCGELLCVHRPDCEYCGRVWNEAGAGARRG